jgi:hypothetical protein
VFVWTILSMMVIAIILALPRARRSWHARAKRLEFDKMVAAFIAEIDNRVRAFELNPELPEIIELKAQAREIMAQAVKHRMRLDNLVLHDLNPYNDVVYTGSHLTIRERTFSHVLRSWSLVEFHIGRWASLDDYITRITVDRTGTHVFSHHMREVVNYHAGKLDPHRLNDPGNRVENAIEFVKHFTGLDLNWQDFWPMYWAEFTKGEDGTWQVEYDREPATAS